MQIGIFGSGVVGKTLASKLASNGHDVMIGTRDPAATAARDTPGQFGEPGMATFLAQNPTIRLGTFAEAAAHGALLINATSGPAALAALELAGEANLRGKPMADLSNPLDFSKGFPPSLTVCNEDSLGEQLQRAFPSVNVVKTLNTVNAWLMVAPQQLAGGDHTMFVCGDDAEAKAAVTAMLKGDFGWSDVLDLGGIAMARGPEMYFALWVRLYMSTKIPMFNIKVVR